MDLPLAGITVVELSQNASAPYAGTILADLGADVTKVEPPRGDEARRWGPPFCDGVAGIYWAMNRNKRLVVADLGNDRERDAIRSLIAERADICIQNLRPGRADALGLGAAEMIRRNPRLVYCSISAFGSAGPMAAMPGFDALAQAMTGVMSVTGDADGAPVRTGTSVCDLGAAMWCAIGAISAIYRRARTGTGGVIDTSLFETGLGWMGYHITNALLAGAEPGRHGSGHPLVVPNAAFATADGRILISANNDKLFGALCRALGAPALAADERFATNPARVAHRAALEPQLAAILGDRSSEHWLDALGAAGVPCAPILSVLDAAQHPQTRALDIVGGQPPVVRLPLTIDGERPPVTSPAPALPGR